MDGILSSASLQNGLLSEFELVRLAASTDPGPEYRNRLQFLLSGELDWERILALARLHRVAPLLSRTITDSNDRRIPEDAANYLRTLVRRIAVRNLVVAAELGKILPLLASEGVPAIPFKGVVLATMAYGNLGLRPSADIDLLLPAETFDSAVRAFVSGGYTPAGHFGRQSGFRRAFYIRLTRQCQFVRASQHTLDVHLGIMPPGYRFVPTFEALMDRSVELTVGGTVCRTFAPEDMLFIMCLHGVKNRWQALKHICDVAELVRARADMDWDVVQRRARESSSERILMLGLVLARQVVAAPVPGEVLREAERDRAIEGISRSILTRLPGAPMSPLDRSGRFRFHMRVQNHASTKVRYLLYTIARRVQEKLRADQRSDRAQATE